MPYRNSNRLKIISLVILTIILASCGAGRTTVSQRKTSGVIQDDVIQYGRQYLGKPYRYAGRGPGSFDCSGYTSFVFRKFGYRLHSSSAGQDKQMPTVARREELRKGDLVFFEGNRKNGAVGHVGIVTEAFSNGQFKFIHSSTTSGVIISSSSEPYYASRYLRGGRVLEDNASYVTRRNPPAPKKQMPQAKPEPVPQTIPEVVPPEKTEQAYLSEATQDLPRNAADPVIIVQTDPQKNPPLGQRAPINGKEAVRVIKNDMALLEEKNAIVASPPTNHTVQSGETLYSISRLYRCSVEQLRTWNPHLKTLLKAGETLLIYTN